MSKKKTQSTLDSDIVGIILITIGILSCYSLFYAKTSGLFGKILKKLLVATFGIGAFIFPFIIIFIGVCYIIKKGSISFSRRFFGIILFILNTLLIIQMASIDVYYKNSIVESIKKIYNSNTLFHGGVISLLIDIPMNKFFGKIGSYILFSSLYIITVILISQIKLQDLFHFLNNKKTKKGEELTVVEEPNINKNKYMKELNKKIKIVDFMKNSLTENDGEENETKEKINEEFEQEIINNSTKEIINYVYPSIELLNQNTLLKLNREDKKELINSAAKLEETLSSFGVEAKVVQVSKGPSVTRFELQPSAGVKVSKIVNLSDDIALNLASSGVRIEAPIPGKAVVGIEVPNKELTPVFLREVIESDEFKNSNRNLAFCLGKDVGGCCIVSDLSKMPHTLIAGATGSGKSVCINTLIISLLYKYSPDNVKLLMIDPKVVELSIYNGIPHLLIPVVTDPKKAAGALNWAVNEMTKRYKLFADNNVRNIEGYNELFTKGKVQAKLPFIVIIIDELADLMMVCPNDVEDYIGRLAQMARAAGMHLVIATQRPSVDVITGVIKANIPSRISFAVSSQIDSRTILDSAGAEKLLGKGDMLFYPVGEAKPIRIQGAFISENEVEKIVDFIKEVKTEEIDTDKQKILDEIDSSTAPKEESSDEDELLDESIKIILDMGQASTSLLQRKLKIGYSRAARIIDQLEERGIISSKDGSKPRQILINQEEYLKGKMLQS